MDQSLVTALVAALILLAGCGGIAGSEPTPSATQTTVSSTQPSTSDIRVETLTTPTTPTRSPIKASGFPAVSGTEVNESRLPLVHNQALSNVSYTIRLEQQAGQKLVNVTARRNGNESWLRTTINGTGETDYINGSTEYLRTKYTDGSVTYRNQSVPNASRYTAHTVLDNYIQSANHSPVAVTTYKGVRVVELTATRDDVKPSGVYSNTTFDVFESRLLVDKQGRIRLFTYRISGTTNGEPFLFTLRFELSNIGSTTVERPEWVSRA